MLLKRSSPTSSHAPKALGVRKSSTAYRRASAAVAKRRYLVRLPFAGLERNSSAGACIVEGSHASTLAQKVTRYEVRFLWLRVREVR